MSRSDALTAQILRSVASYSCRLTWEQRHRFGKRIGRFFKIDRRRLSITKENVHRAFPHLSERECSAIVNGAYENLGITLAELMAVPTLTPESLRNRMSIPNIEWVRERTQRGEASILLSGHYGNWEYLAMAAGIEINSPVTIVAHPQKNPVVDADLNAFRTRFGNVIVPMHDAARGLVKTLTEGGTVAFLVDQHANRDRDPWIEFFGRKTPTYEAPAALALRFDVPIYYAFAERQTDGRYVAPLTKLDMDGLGKDKESAIELTRRHVHVLEQAIIRQPHLWSWQHRRWRHEPPPNHDGNRYDEATRRQ